jgi:CRP-like cAMP-binding protein
LLKAFEKGARIFEEGKPAEKIYSLFVGRVKRVKSTPDWDLIIEILGPGKPVDRFRIVERLGTDRARGLAAGAQRSRAALPALSAALRALRRQAGRGETGQAVMMDLSTKYLGLRASASPDVGRLYARGRHGHGATVGGLRRGGHRHALALRRADLLRAPGGSSRRRSGATRDLLRKV